MWGVLGGERHERKLPGPTVAPVIAIELLAQQLQSRWMRLRTVESFASSRFAIARGERSSKKRRRSVVR